MVSKSTPGALRPHSPRAVRVVAAPLASQMRPRTRSLRSSKNWIQQQAEEHRCGQQASAACLGHHLARLQLEQQRLAMVAACWRSHQQSRLTMAPQAPLLLGQRHPLSGRRRRPRAGRCGPGAWFRQPAAAPTHTLKGHILNPKAVPTTISLASPMSRILWPGTTPRWSMPRHLTRSFRSSRNWMQQQADEHRCEHLARLQADQKALPLP